MTLKHHFFHQLSIDQKIFQGFKGYNSLKKSELEFKQADFKLNQNNYTLEKIGMEALFKLLLLEIV